jgi:hypothetical protein
MRFQSTNHWSEVSRAFVVAVRILFWVQAA